MFHRRWKYDLLSCAGAFRARSQQLFQSVMTGPGPGAAWPPRLTDGELRRDEEYPHLRIVALP
jgi:hypothetical protein